MTTIQCLECSRPAHTRGWCKSHYDAWRRTGDAKSYHGDLSLWERVQRIGWTVNVETGCNEWNGYRNELGYGQIRHERKLYRVHRLVYERLVGDLLPEDHVLHECDNPACSKPDHLFKGDQGSNVKDMRKKFRGYKDDWTHCPNGHEYPADCPPRSARNRCKECARDRNRRYYAKKHAT